MRHRYSKRLALQIGVIGLGPWGLNLVRAFAGARRCRVVALCDLDPLRLREGMRILPAATPFSHARDLLERSELDAVVIATSSPSHAQLALAALAAGKHVFVEKPLALSVEDARRVRDRASRSGLNVMVGHVVCYNSGIQDLRLRLASGAIGDVRCVAARRTGQFSTRRDEGVWWSLAPHDISVIRLLFDAEPTEIAAKAGHVCGEGCPERVSARLVFSGQRDACILVGSEEGTKIRRLAVLGTNALALFDDAGANARLSIIEPPERIHNARDLLGVLDHKIADLPEPFSALGVQPLQAEVEHFVRSILDGIPHLSTAHDGYAVVSILAAGAQSIALRGEPMPLTTLGRYPGVRDRVPRSNESAAPDRDVGY